MPAYTDIQTFIMVLFALFAGIIVVDKIVDIVKKYKQPGANVGEEIKEIKGHLDNDNKRISKLEESSKLTLRGINALIEYDINGETDDKKKLEDVKEDITDFLINRS